MEKTREPERKPGITKGDFTMYRNFVHSILMNRPFQPMFEADKGSGGGDQGSGDQGSGSGDQGDQGGGNNDGGDGSGNNQNNNNSNDNNHDKKDPVTFSEEQQNFINNLINKTIKDERTKAEKERDKELERQKMDENQRREADLKDAQAKLDQFKNRSLTYEIKDVAREMGVPANKLDRFLKLVDRDEVDVDDDGSVDRSKVSGIVKAVLGDFPEFKAGEGSGKGPGGDFDKGSGSGAKYSMAQIKDMSQNEIKDNWDDVQKSMAIHNKQSKK